MMKKRQLSQSRLQVEAEVTRDGAFHQYYRWNLFSMFPCALLLTLCFLDGREVVLKHHKVSDCAHPERQVSMGREESQTTMLHASKKVIGPMVDIISIGSLLKEEFQDAQMRTFGSYSGVRNFFRITERNDTDAECFTELNTEQIDRIIEFCSNTKHQTYISEIFRGQLFEPKKHTGWMCAQKRPLDGLYQVLQRYVNGQDTIPDYVFVIDDDTFLNMNRLVPDLAQHFPADHPFAVAGCNFNFLTESGVTFPYGGFGSFLTRKAVERLIQPFYCDGRDEHSNLACWRLNMNAMGEKQFYKEGMSVSDLMHAYARNLPLTGVDHWTNTGYCLHSDHALAYFINFYHIMVPEGTVLRTERPNDKPRRKFSYVGLTGEHECLHQRENCTFDNRVCHYIKPVQMDALFEEQMTKN
jgi:hypothetical protein